MREGNLPPQITFRPLSVYDESTVFAVILFGLNPDGTLDIETNRQLSVPISDRVAQLQFTLGWWRWVSQAFGALPVVINLPDFKLRAYDAELNVVLWMEVIVGGAYHRQTLFFRTRYPPSTSGLVRTCCRTSSTARWSQQCDATPSISRGMAMSRSTPQCTVRRQSRYLWLIPPSFSRVRNWICWRR